MQKKLLPLIGLSFLILSLILTAGCAGKAAGSASSTDLAMAPMSSMPDNVKSAASTVQQAYQFAAANPDLMKQIPCYCGCGAMGHTSNYSCYVNAVDNQGKISFDDHALGCGICVDITQDVMRLTREKKSPQDIRAYIDQTYSKYGPSNISSGQK